MQKSTLTQPSTSSRKVGLPTACPELDPGSDEQLWKQYSWLMQSLKPTRPRISKMSATKSGPLLACCAQVRSKRLLTAASGKLRGEASPKGSSANVCMCAIACVFRTSAYEMVVVANTRSRFCFSTSLSIESKLLAFAGSNLDVTRFPIREA